jgi:hypothetical protein
LRPTQHGAAWEELRADVAQLVARLTCDHHADANILDARPGICDAACVALSECEAALRCDDGVFLIASETPWTSMRDTHTWRAPRDPAITMLYADLPEGALLH